MDEEKQEQLRDAIARYDSDETGCLTREEFCRFMEWAFSRDNTDCVAPDGFVPEMNEEVSDFIFNGIASASAEQVTPEEIIDFFEIGYNNDQKGFIKVTFKALDPENTGWVKLGALMDAARLFGVELSGTTFLETFKKKHGMKGSDEEAKDAQVTMPEFYQCVTGEDYYGEGRAPPKAEAKKSSCCLLI